MDPATLALVAEIERVLRPHADSMGALPSKTARDLMVGADDVPNALEGIVGVVEVSGRVQIGEIVAFIRRQCSGPSEELAMKSESRLDPMICRAYEVARASKDSGASLAGPLIEPEGVTERTYEFTSTPDGNVVKILFVRRRDAADVLLSPCVVYFHGGGMASGSAYDPQHRNWYYRAVSAEKLSLDHLGYTYESAGVGGAHHRRVIISSVLQSAPSERCRMGTHEPHVSSKEREREKETLGAGLGAWLFTAR